MITHKDRQMGPTTMKLARDMANPKRGVYDPVGKAIKGVCPGMMTHKDQEIDRAVRKYTKGLITSRMGGAPQCGMPLQISIRWKWLKGTLRVSNDAPLRAHIDEEM